MKIAVSGASGLLGSALVRSLEADGHHVEPLVRQQGSQGILWDPGKGSFDAEKLEGFDAVFHLAGESIASGRWTAARKQRILQSRELGTQILAEGLSRLERPPGSLICASAIGFYGDRGDEWLTEDSASGTGFLAEVCRRWEDAAAAVDAVGIRRVHARIGIVISRHGGALKEMLTPFRLGAGGPIGGGRQFYSWIHLDDVVAGLQHCLEAPSLKGPVNLVAPTPERQGDFARVLGSTLKRPAIVPAPAFMVRALLGEMADELLLASIRVRPDALTMDGFDFRHCDLRSALGQELGA